METDMTISTYDRTIKPHLENAQEYAYRAAREIGRLPLRPTFFTLAQYELERAESRVTQLLATIREAKREYEAKPIETVENVS
jgi:arginine utilization protein RocB